MLPIQLTKTESSVQIRSMANKDIAAVQKLAEKIWLAFYPSIISMEQVRFMLETMYNRELLEKRLSQKEYGFLLAESNGELVGFTGYEDRGRGSFFLHRLYVDTDKHRQGIGSALMNVLKRQLEPKILSLHVNKKNITAQQFYKKHGFKVTREQYTEIGHGFVMDDYVMEWGV